MVTANKKMHLTEGIESHVKRFSESERHAAVVANDVLSGFLGSKILGLLQQIARRSVREGGAKSTFFGGGNERD
jgi:hypothetical protein